jgi:hypothetical protein
MEHITLINYANLTYYQSQKQNSETAISIGKVVNVISYSINDIDLEFKLQHSYILNQRRGAGYWLWKPYFILKTLKEKIKEGDYLFYSDSGASFVSSVRPIIELMKSENQDIACFEIFGYQERDWTKRDTFIIMECDIPEYQNTYQRMAAFQIIKKTSLTLKFYEEYLKYSCDPRCISDIPNQLGKDNYTGFKDHRHDQSIFSLLTKKYGFKVFKDITQFSIEGLGKSQALGNYGQILNHHRHRV